MGENGEGVLVYQLPITVQIYARMKLHSAAGGSTFRCAAVVYITNAISFTIRSLPICLLMSVVGDKWIHTSISYVYILHFQSIGLLV